MSLVRAARGQWQAACRAVARSAPVQRKAAAVVPAAHFPRVASRCLSSVGAEQAFIEWGHLAAAMDPKALMQGRNELESAGKEAFQTATGLDVDDPQFAELRNKYCGHIAIEAAHVSNAAVRDWATNTARQLAENPAQFVTPGERRNAAMAMLKADVFEEYLHVKHPTFKRYSGEGADAMHAALEQIIASAAANGVDDIVVAMPHRGRLAFLTSSLKYPVGKMVYKIRGLSELPPEPSEAVYGIDDVTSHIAASVDRDVVGKRVHVSLLHNPSHLEIAGAVAIGKARAKIAEGRNAVPLLIHGDAAVSGQGCIPEAGSLWNLNGFKVGGSLHMVVNNQIGFTTDPKDGRSGRHCTDFAKTLDAPVIHVNGASVDAVIAAAKLAVAFRQQFHRDVVIDLHSFRRYGHNEVDEPALTQPQMYKTISALPNPTVLYCEQLHNDGLLSKEKVAGLRQQFRDYLENEGKKADEFKPTRAEIDAFRGKWSECTFSDGASLRADVKTGVPTPILQHIAASSVAVPPNFEIHHRLKKSHVGKRLEYLNNNQADWSSAEAMAFGSLLAQGHNVRICGQDVQRGTFSQRHAGLTDQNTGERYFPLQHLEGASGRFEAVNSNLSELGVMAFEYGYSLESPRNLVLWEAQFGDFFNTAQVVVDQFIASGEAKWFRQTGLTLLLPHGMDGAGPEHSSGKPERFLQLCDSPFVIGPDGSFNSSPSPDFDTNMQVAWPSTPASYFHLLRRQQLRAFRKPLVLMIPKTLLRHNDAVSSLSEMSENTTFQPVLDDVVAREKPKSVKRVILCNGKLYYDLRKTVDENKLSDKIAIVRLEEIHPFPFMQLAAVLRNYKNATELCYAQEEAANGGAWSFVQPHLAWLLKNENLSFGPIRYIGRPSLPASAVGLSKDNAKQQVELLKQALKL